MGFTNQEYIECNYNGKSIKVSPFITTALQLINKDIEDKWDSIILVTGDVGSGKSTLAMTIAGMYQKLRGEELTIDHFTWTSEGLVEFTDRQDNYEEPIIYDEAIQGGAGKDIMTKAGKHLTNALVTKRRKRHLTIVIVDQLQEFNRKFIARCYMTIDCRVLIKEHKRVRGYFKAYSQKETLHLYSLLKKGSIRDIRQYSGKYKPFFRFWDSTDVFINENEYEQKKIEQTNSIIDDNSKIEWTKQKLEAFMYYVKGGLTQREIAGKVGLTQPTINVYITEFKKIIDLRGI